MDIHFKDKVILVTGSGQGIGNELCKRLSKFGAKVIAVSRSEQPLKELKAEFPEIQIISVDLGNWADTVKALKSIEKLDGLVNNAGIAIIKPLEEVTEQDFDDTFNSNVKSVFNVSQILSPKMKEGSSIVNVSSLASMSAFQNHSIYCASKAAVDSLTRSLTLELGPKKIRVNSVNPTVILTRMGRDNWSDPEKSEKLLSRIPSRRFGEVDEVIDAIVYLLSDKSSFVNGISMPLEGGFKAC